MFISIKIVSEISDIHAFKHPYVNVSGILHRQQADNHHVVHHGYGLSIASIGETVLFHHRTIQHHVFVCHPSSMCSSISIIKFFRC